MRARMAYRLRSGESASDGLRRVTRKALRSARRALLATDPPREEAIHEARKSVKKVRAILELIDADKGKGLSGSRNRLGRVNRRLSCLRDADAMLGTLQTLRDHHPGLLSEHVFARVRRQLAAHKQAIARDAIRDGTWTKTARELRALRRTAKRWRPAHRGFDALAPGIRETHRRALKAFGTAQSTNQPADFHEWRKAVKTLWYELRLIGGGSPAIARDLRALRSAETWLGDDHNLVVLCAQLSADPSVCRTPLDVERLRSAVERDHRDLRRKAIARTRRIFAVMPREYTRRAERAWKAGRRAARTRGRAA